MGKQNKKRSGGNKKKKKRNTNAAKNKQQAEAAVTPTESTETVPKDDEVSASAASSEGGYLGGEESEGGATGKDDKGPEKSDAVAAAAAAAAAEKDTTAATTKVEEKAETPAAEDTKEALSQPEPQPQPEAEAEETEPAIPPGLQSSLHLFTDRQRKLALSLCSPEANQRHLFEQWTSDTDTDDDDDDKKRRFMSQLERMDDAYPTGGLLGYITNAKDLLDKSRRGVNPLEGWKPSVPAGKEFDVGTKEFDETERIGLKEVGKCGFVLVAGGLGERLGYGDIKIGLPTELATETCYLQFYIQTILAFQTKYGEAGQKLPLCIMVSGDTNKGTMELLRKNGNFGMDDGQISIVEQGEGVPALENNDARIALDSTDRYRVQSKPHGHGDIHALLHSNGVAKRWLDGGIQWAVFFQDTNGLAFHTLPLALGVSSQMGLVMNSITIPRKAKQAIGGIAKLENSQGEHRTINVEYNQLDPLLRASGFPEGDVNDEKTGHSPFPGNINQLVFSLPPYVDALVRTNGAMPEFVNPKYKDAEKTVFKKPTRLECMMQDFPTVLKGQDSEKVGFTCIPHDISFSPVKNATADGVSLQQKGIQPGVPASGEADQYAAVRKIMRSIGCNVEEASPAAYIGITVVPGPAVVPKPDFVSCPADYKEKFPHPSEVKITGRSSLVVQGSGVVIKSLDLDGALVIRCEDGASGVISGLVVKNKGWDNIVDESGENEIIRMRGYRLNRIETRKITFKKDGSIEGDYTPAADFTETIEPAAEEPPMVSPTEPSSGSSGAASDTATKVPEPSPTPLASEVLTEKAEEAAAPTQPTPEKPKLADTEPQKPTNGKSTESAKQTNVSSAGSAAPSEPSPAKKEGEASSTSKKEPKEAPESPPVSDTASPRKAPDLSEPAPEDMEGSNRCGCIIS